MHILRYYHKQMKPLPNFGLVQLLQYLLQAPPKEAQETRRPLRLNASACHHFHGIFTAVVYSGRSSVAICAVPASGHAGLKY
jgi:hypothetical protein